jgi:Lon protease-like protein
VHGAGGCKVAPLHSHLAHRTMSDLLPLFPLPNVVLFPNVFLPLHIFEPRYRELIADAIGSDRLIGMVLLRPGWESDYDGRPPVYPIGCSGLLTHVERAPDGRYNIVLRGVERFRIVEEDHAHSYRRALVQSLAESELTTDDRAAIRIRRARLESILTPAVERTTLREPQRRPEPRRGTTASGHEFRIPSSMSDEDLVNALAQYLDLEPLEKQALLEHNSLRTRIESLVDLLEMKMMMARTPGLSKVAH